MNILYITLLAIASGICFRLGGSSLNIPLKSKIRDWGCALCSIPALMLVGINGEWWQWIGLFLTSWLFLSTYNDRWGTDDVEWYEWALTGATYALPVLFFGATWNILVRAIVLACFMPLSNYLQFKVFSDKTDGVEMSRGLMYILTIMI